LNINGTSLVLDIKAKDGDRRQTKTPDPRLLSNRNAQSLLQTRMKCRPRPGKGCLVSWAVDTVLPSSTDQTLGTSRATKEVLSCFYGESLPIPGDGSDANTKPKTAMYMWVDHKGTVTSERRSEIRPGPEYPAKSLFQGNNSVLVPLISYVYDAIFTADGVSNKPHLVDTHCGATGRSQSRFRTSLKRSSGSSSQRILTLGRETFRRFPSRRDCAAH
jgi:hypothetical protein